MGNISYPARFRLPIPRVWYTDCFLGPATIALARAFTVAAIPSILEELVERSGLANIRLSFCFFAVRQLAFYRSTGCPP
jgi:hypothetical protein